MQMTENFLHMIIPRGSSEISRISLAILLFSAFPVHGFANSAVDNLNSYIVENADTAIPMTSKYWYHHGLDAMKSKKYKEARNYFQKTINQDPDYFKAYNKLGIVYLKLDKKKEAIDAFRKAVNLKSNYTKAYNNLGIAYGKSDMYEDALSAFQRALTLRPDYAKAYNNIGVIYYEQGMYNKAIEAFNNALELKSHYENATQNLELTHLAMSDKDSRCDEMFYTIYDSSTLFFFTDSAWVTRSPYYSRPLYTPLRILLSDCPGRYPAYQSPFHFYPGGPSR
jgi:tetratricopeptide (TPR) repeat protein